MKIKLLVITHSPTLPSGYGNIAADIFRGLLKCFPGAYDIMQVATRRDQEQQWPHWPIACLEGDSLSSNTNLSSELIRLIHESASSFQPDIVFFMEDPQMIQAITESVHFGNARKVGYVAMDGIMPTNKFQKLEKLDQLVFFSDFGKSVYKNGFTHEKMHLVIYPPLRRIKGKQVPKSDLFVGHESALRALHECEHSMLMGWVGLNQWRKQVWAPIHVLKTLRCGEYAECDQCNKIEIWPDSMQLKQSRGQKCVRCGKGTMRVGEKMNHLYLHVHRHQHASSPVWPMELLRSIYKVDDGLIHTHRRYKGKKVLGRGDMQDIYRHYDVLLYLTGGEGFGMPVIEAAMHGVTTICPNYSSQAEIVNKYGLGTTVNCTLQPESRTSNLRAVADMGHVIEVVKRIYRQKINHPQTHDSSASAYLAENNITAVARRWDSVFRVSHHQMIA